MSQKTIIIKVPEVASITITGPTQCGKSIIMDRIKKMLEKETIEQWNKHRTKKNKAA